MADRELILRPGERLDDLQNGGLALIQRPDAFCFGTDSVLLADFAAPKKRDRAIDLGCGTGAIATLMAAHCPNLCVDAVELQPEAADMAARSARYNGLDDRLHVYCMDAREAWRHMGREAYTLVVCNPPYGKAGGGPRRAGSAQQTARCEDELDCHELCRTAFALLRAGGRLCVVFPAVRAFEMMQAMQAHRLAPKRIRTVQGVEGRAPRLVLLEAVKDGGSGLAWMPPLILQRADGTHTPEWERIYLRDPHSNAR